MRKKWKQFRHWILENLRPLIDVVVSLPYLKIFAPLWFNRRSVELLLNNNLPSRGLPAPDLSVSVVNTGQVPVTVRDLELRFGDRVFTKSEPSYTVNFFCLERDELVTLKPGEYFKRTLPKKHVWSVLNQPGPIRQAAYGEKTIYCRIACLLIGESGYRFDSGTHGFGIAYFE